MDKNEKNKQQEQEDLQGYWNYLSHSTANMGKLKDRIKQDNEIAKTEERENKNTSGFTILAHIYVFLSMVILIVMCVVFPEPGSIIIFCISSIISISCLYGLGGARERISYIEEDMYDVMKENKEIKNKLKQLEKDLRNKIDKRDSKE